MIKWTHIPHETDPMIKTWFTPFCFYSIYRVDGRLSLVQHLKTGDESEDGITLMTADETEEGLVQLANQAKIDFKLRVRSCENMIEDLDI